MWHLVPPLLWLAQLQLSRPVFQIGFYGAFAEDMACQQGTFTLLDTWFHPFWDLLILQLLRQVFPIRIHGVFAKGVACQQRTLTLPDTWFCPVRGLLMLQLLMLIYQMVSKEHLQRVYWPVGNTYPSGIWFVPFRDLLNMLQLLKAAFPIVFHGTFTTVLHASRACLPFSTPGSASFWDLLMLQLLRPVSRMVSIDHLQRVLHVSRERLPFRRPGSVPFATRLCFSWDQFPRACRVFSRLFTLNIPRYFLDFIFPCLLLFKLCDAIFLNP